MKSMPKKKIGFLAILRAFLNRKKFHIMILIMSLWMALGTLSGTFVAALNSWVLLSAVILFASLCYLAGYCLLYPLKYVLGGSK